MRRVLALAAAAIFLMAAAPDPADMLTDKAQEARARQIFKEVRCIVCQNESIDDSEAQLARDLRQIIRGQIATGHSKAQVEAFLVSKYGEFILLKPVFSLGNALLWLGPFIIVLAGLGVAMSRRRAVSDEGDLTAEEVKRLTKLQENLVNHPRD